MAPPTVLGMSVYSFVASVCSAIGAVFTIINGSRKLIPTKRYTASVKMYNEAVESWRELDKSCDILLPKHRKGFSTVIISLEKDLKKLWYLRRSPGFNLILLVRGVFKLLAVKRLARDIDKLRISILWLSTQDMYVKKLKKKSETTGVFVNVTPIEERFRKMADMLIGSYGRRVPDYKVDVPDVHKEIEREASQAIGASGLNLRPHVDDPSASTVIQAPIRAVPQAGRPYPAPLQR